MIIAFLSMSFESVFNSYSSAGHVSSEVSLELGSHLVLDMLTSRCSISYNSRDVLALGVVLIFILISFTAVCGTHN
jgi:hypothetical protein